MIVVVVMVLPKSVAVGGLDVNMCLNEGVPLAHKGAELVLGQVHAVEVGEAVVALDIFHPDGRDDWL